MLKIIKTIPELLNAGGLSKQAKAVTLPTETKAQLEQLLSTDKMGSDSIDFLAHNMPEQKATWWAVQSAEMVKEQLKEPDVKAMAAAHEWVLNPNPDTQAAAAEAAKLTDFKGPGAWAAQAAAWSGDTLPTLPNTDAENQWLEPLNEAIQLAGQQKNTGTAVAGSVKLAAAMKANPESMQKILKLGEIDVPEIPPMQISAPEGEIPQFQMPDMPPPPEPLEMTNKELKTAFKAFKPFIEIGLAIAADKNRWT